ncbi:MAG: hypothetical protein VB115_08295 [Christensenellaceae bacterium]|nr:hypothetical protein [Christensenellaceae bacterium]
MVTVILIAMRQVERHALMNENMFSIVFITALAVPILLMFVPVVKYRAREQAWGFSNLLRGGLNMRRIKSLWNFLAITAIIMVTMMHLLGGTALTTDFAYEGTTIYFTPFAGCIGYESNHPKMESLRLSGLIRSDEPESAILEMLYTATAPYMKAGNGSIVRFKEPADNAWQLHARDDAFYAFVIDLYLAPHQELPEDFSSDVFSITINDLERQFQMAGLKLFFQHVEDTEHLQFDITSMPVVFTSLSDGDDWLSVAYNLLIDNQRVDQVDSMDIIAPGIDVSQISYKKTDQEDTGAVFTLTYRVRKPVDGGQMPYVVNIQPIVKVTIAGEPQYCSLYYGLPLEPPMDESLIQHLLNSHGQKLS